jgi:hypothetical protein
MERKDEPAPLLFRSTLYAPLAAYQQTRVSPAEFTRTTTRVAKELHESSLYKFLQHVSNHHHAKPNQLHAKNTAGKPLKEYEDRIQQRALNLVGGDFYGHTKVKSQRAKTVKRRRPAEQNCAFSRSAEATIKSDHLFLDHLNKLWNDYAQTFMKTQTKLKVAVNEMEWIGALVRIDGCPAFRNWKGYKGIVVQHTNKSWHVYVKGQRQNKARKQVNKLLYLPKATTKLAALTYKKTGNDSEHLCTVIHIENGKR